ncbi:histidine kinase [Pararobbsia alpina]|uniref:Histidine kinase n=1 Tax=Pararobbsia alpina TaxID=621374 RepID=A0A6S7B6Q3_9BURK|nr:histidine kinase [Pararobbsia alpina]CAB3789952.1 hypothetical protein LMG28138_02879 [Pararobbsia alpina]
MDASQPERRQLKLRDLTEAMRKLGIAVRLDEPQTGCVPDARGAALAIVSPDGSFLSVNRSAATLLGYASGELVGRQLLALAPEANRVALGMQLSVESASEFRSFSTMLMGRAGRPLRLTLHQQRIAAEHEKDRAQLTLFEEPLESDAPANGSTVAGADARDRLTYLMMGQQIERQRLAADLHDGLGQALTLIKLMVEDARMRLGRGKTEDVEQQLDATVLQIRDTIGEMRQICDELRPLALERLGLPAALSTLCRRVERSAEKLVVTFHFDVDDRDVPEHLKADIFRVAQEALNNTVKHAQASEVRLDFQRTHASLLLTIQDNGIGYDTRPLPPDEMSLAGLGLVGMQQRVESQGGLLSVHSSGVSGTVVSASWVL